MRLSCSKTFCLHLKSCLSFLLVSHQTNINPNPIHDCSDLQSRDLSDEYNYEFLAHNLDEKIYIKQSKRFIDETNKVCKLERSLYKLKQSTRLWNQYLDQYLRKIEFDQINMNHCLYINKNISIIIAMWVNDLIVFNKDIMRIDLLKQWLKTKFEMKNTRELQYFLDIQIHHDRKNR